MLSDKGLELSDQLGMATAGQVGVDALLRGSGALLVKASYLGLGERLECHVAQCGPAPELEGVAQPVRRRLGIGPVRVGHQSLEARGVDLGGPHVQDVARRLSDEPAVAELLPEPRHIYLDALQRGAGRRLTPELVDQAIGGNNLVGVDEQQREQGALAPAAE